MLRWKGITPGELHLLETTFWSTGGSRHGMAERLGYSRSKTNALIASLMAQGLLAETGLQPSSGGRRAETLRLNADLGVLLAVDIGATSLDIALMAPDLTVIGHRTESADVRQGPGLLLARVRLLLRELLREHGFESRQVLGIGVGVPGPVDFG
ncbi:MAG: ROK family transcriptional regulator, partial [Comamonadaceae bacterium]